MADPPRWTQNRTRCRACGVRWGQSPRWLCRACDRAAGTYVPPVHAPRTTCRRCGVESEPAEGLCARCWQALAEEVAATVRPTPAAVVHVSCVRVVRERRVGRRVYDVVWDGTRG
jgi:hypothetical protein